MNPYGRNFAEIYDRRFSDYAKRAAPHLIRFFSTQPHINSYPRVLDLGCGTGHLAFHFLEAGYDFTGLDLSPDMLLKAEERCRRHLVSGKADFVEGNLSGFEIPGPFGMVVSTYNSLNHLETQAALRGCFQSVRLSLAPGGAFVFDYHTALGLRAWAGDEASSLEGESVRSHGEFDETKGRAVMRLKIAVGNELFETVIENQTFSMAEIAKWLREEGFQQVRFSEMSDLEKTVADPEAEKRVVVIAS